MWNLLHVSVHYRCRAGCFAHLSIGKVQYERQKRNTKVVLRFVVQWPESLKDGRRGECRGWLV